jgi:hypothetical protein
MTKAALFHHLTQKACGISLGVWYTTYHLENKSTGSLLHYAARPISWNELHDNKDTFAAASNQEQIVRVEEGKTKDNMTSIDKYWYSVA